MERKDREQFVDFLENTLIPDLKENGKVSTAEDFEKAVEIIEELELPEENVAKWTDESKPIIESANLDGDFFRINADITLRDTNVMGVYALQNIVEHLRCIVRAFDVSETYLKSGKVE